MLVDYETTTPYISSLKPDDSLVSTSLYVKNLAPGLSLGVTTYIQFI